jgi:hypothetical protein
MVIVPVRTPESLIVRIRATFSTERSVLIMNGRF